MALKHLGKDPTFRGLIKKHGEPEFSPTRDPFRTLLRAIVSQQLSGKAADTIWNRFANLSATPHAPRPEHVLALPLQALRGAGLSGQKASYVMDLARFFSDGRLSNQFFVKPDDEVVRATLLQVKGIGPWSVDMFMMFGLCRPDILPVGDLGIQKGMQRFFALRQKPTPQKMVILAEGWRPYRTIASWYMWRILEQ